MPQSTEPLCARCARHQRTCCQDTEVYLSPADRDRLIAWSGRDDLLRWRVAGPEYIDVAGDPTWARLVFRPDGSRRLLAQSADGDCVLLGPQGCTAPAEVRPLICRLYPLQYTEAGLQGPAGACPVQLLGPDEALLSSIGVDRERSERLHQQLYAELWLELDEL